MISKLNLANVIIKFEQSEISNNDQLHVLKKSLNIFFDDDDIIRVKDLLENSDLDVETKYPNILLKDDHYFCTYKSKSIWHDGVQVQKIEWAVVGRPGRKLFSVSEKTNPYRENQSLSGKPILIGKTNPYRENQSSVKQTNNTRHHDGSI